MLALSLAAAAAHIPAQFAARSSVCMCVTDARLAANEVKCWLKDSGGTANVVVGPTAFGLGLLAPDDVNEGDIVVSVPSACILTTKSVENLELSKLIDDVPEEFWAARLALVLLAERAQGSASSKVAHLSSLPMSYTNPIFWSPDAVGELRGYPAVQTQLLKQARFINEFATEKLATCSSSAFGGVTVGADGYGWAIAACSSRAISLGGQRGLVPVIDLGNHASKGVANCNVKGTLGGRVELVANRPIALGDEITYNYGTRQPIDLKLRSACTRCACC